MGRELRRVPLDFNWPIDQIWQGFLNPFWKYHKDCPDCKLGYSKEGQFLHDSFYPMYQQELWEVWAGRNLLAVPSTERLKEMGWNEKVRENVDLARKFGFKSLTCWEDKLDEGDVKALIDDHRLWDMTHDCVQGTGWVQKNPPYIPTPDEVNAWSGRGMGHDALNQGTLIRYRCEKLGINPQCQTCDGSAQVWPDPEMKKKYKEWVREDPPKGEGFQLWTTTNEGAPITPVFGTLDDLAQYASMNCTTFGSVKASAAEWKEMLEKNFVHHRMGNVLCI